MKTARVMYSLSSVPGRVSMHRLVSGTGPVPMCWLRAQAGKALWMFMLFILLVSGCYKEVMITEPVPSAGIVRVVSFDGVEAFVDTVERMILYTIGQDSVDAFSPVVDYHGYRRVLIEGKEIQRGAVNELGLVTTRKSYLLVAEKDQGADTFNLVFTSLPLLHLIPEDSIPDEPKVPAWLELQYTRPGTSAGSAASFTSHAGVEIRGKSATRFAKKSFALELWENRYGVDRVAPLLGMRYGEDWILDAMYIDPLRMRNKLSFELWQKMSKVPEENGREDLFPGIQFKFVELFISNRYWGLYCLGEKLDEKILEFSLHQDEEGGVLYKAVDWDYGSTMFEVTDTAAPPESFYWDGWEQVYPDKTASWEALAELRNCVVLDHDSVFTARIGKLIDLDNASDFYLFVNLILGYDNVGKNIYYARYTDRSRMFMMPWDVEATWGKMWDLTNSNTFGILGNHLFERLIELNVEGFREELLHEWSDCRQGIFHYDSLMLPVSRYCSLLTESGAIDRENARWEGAAIDFAGEHAYISEWTGDRLKYLDGHFESVSRNE
jgi:spore coat protein H